MASTAGISPFVFMLVALISLLIYLCCQTYSINTSSDTFVINNHATHLSKDEIDKITMEEATRIDFDAPCDVRAVMTVLYDPQQPLTSSELLKLRGCLILLFWRTPRSGSGAMYCLVEKLAEKIGYEHGHGGGDRGGKKHYDTVKMINSRTLNKQPLSVVSHKLADDMYSELIKPAIVVNLLRHPVNHIVSLFKLEKYGGRRIEGHGKELSTNCNVSFSAHVMEYGVDGRCLKGSSMGMKYLCGLCKQCRENRSVCLQQAKTNVESLYLVVGISENIPAYLFVLETLLPQFYYGALEQYTRMPGLYEMFSPDPHRDEQLTPEVLEYLHTALADDLELYHYVVQRNYLAVKKALELNANPGLEDSDLLRFRDFNATAM